MRLLHRLGTIKICIYSGQSAQCLVEGLVLLKTTPTCNKCSHYHVYLRILCGAYVQSKIKMNR